MYNLIVDRLDSISHSVFVDTNGFYVIGKQIPKTRLTPIAVLDEYKKKRALFYRCKCECGKEVVTQPYYIQAGRTKSCGCFKVDSAKNRKTHGLSKVPEFEAAKNAFDRCTNRKNRFYPSYGARGIKVKFSNPEVFARWLLDKLPKPKGKFCLDRIENNGNYEPGNLKWSTPKESGRNKRGNRRLTIGNSTKTLSEWAETSGVCSMTIHCRIKAGVPEALWLHKGKITKATLFKELSKA